MSKKIDIDLINLYLLYLFTFLIIFVVKKILIGYSTYIYVYSGVIIGLWYIISFRHYNFTVIKKNFKHIDFMLILLILTYCIYIIIDTIYIKPTAMIYTLTKVIPLIVIIPLIIQYKLDYKKIIIINTFISRILYISMILAFIMYFFGYSNIYISRTGIKFATLNQTAVFADKSLQWLFWHKSRFATFCFLALIYLFNISNIRILDKALLLIIIESNLYFSNSHTFLALSFVYIIYFLFKKFKNINKYLKVSLFIISLIIILVIFIKLIIPLITNGRNVGSLGNRTFIWRYSIELIKQNPFGNIILNRNSGFILQNRLYINSAHNIFLNEFIESGFLGGILYFLIVILLLKRILSNDKRIFFGVLLILLGGCFDIILFEAMNPIFWYTIAIFYSYNNYQKYNWIGRKIENVPISNSYYNLI